MKTKTNTINIIFGVNIDVPSEVNAQAKALVCEGLELLLKREISTLTNAQAILLREMLREH